MRIISGYAKGRRLKAPSSQLIRPTTDRVRESLFSILGELQDRVVLDAFAGSGALGCEALSRGASFCYFFDPAKAAIDIVSHNVEVLHAAQRALITRLPVERALHLLQHEPDVLFLDPPYHKPELLTRALEALAASPRVTADALFVIEQDLDAPLPDHPALLFDEERLYGRTRITFWRRAP